LRSSTTTLERCSDSDKIEYLSPSQVRSNKLDRIAVFHGQVDEEFENAVRVFCWQSYSTRALYSTFRCKSIQLHLCKIHMKYSTDSENNVNGVDQRGKLDDEPEDIRELDADMNKAWERSVWAGGRD
jgi:hypothetical protein